MRDEIQEFMTYLREDKKSSANTEASYRRDLQKAAAYFAEQEITDVRQITATNIRSYLLYLEKRQFASSTVSRNVASLHAFFHYLFRVRKIEEDPSEQLHPPKVEKKAPVILSVDQLDRLMNQPREDTTKGMRDRAMLELLYATGIRVSELISLKVTDVNLPLAYISSPSHDRMIPFGDTARQSLQRYLGVARPALIGDNCEYLFPNCQGHPMSRQGFWKLLKGYAEDAGIQEDITPHTLRHSFAAHLIENGADIHTVQQMLGHSDISTTQMYVQMHVQRMRTVYDTCHPNVI
ncbi:MAG: site-specific tyrosine recombinase XerD [Lachnospiraceae bacterium]